MRIERIGDNKVRFTQNEIFSGMLVRLFAKSLDRDTLRGFNEMNQALRERAERRAKDDARTAERLYELG